MFVIPTRSRPQNIKRLAAAFRETGATTPAIVCLDDDDPMKSAYDALDCPRNWEFFVSGRAPLSTIYNRVLNYLPDLPWYGFLADDVVPETQGWDKALIERAGSDGMAVPSGGETTGGCPHFVLGGDLVRSVGWLALPGLARLYIDTVWGDLAQARGVYRYIPGVRLAHRHFSSGQAFMDSTYRKKNKVKDRQIYEAWGREFSV